jgi:hypothetical protein
LPEENKQMSNPHPMTVSEFTKRLDALVTEFSAGAEACGCDTAAGSMRSPRASWCLALSHAEHRVHSINRAGNAKAGKA